MSARINLAGPSLPTFNGFKLRQDIGMSQAPRTTSAAQHLKSLPRSLLSEAEQPRRPGPERPPKGASDRSKRRAPRRPNGCTFVASGGSCAVCSTRRCLLGGFSAQVGAFWASTSGGPGRWWHSRPTHGAAGCWGAGHICRAGGPRPHSKPLSISAADGHRSQCACRPEEDSQPVLRQLFASGYLGHLIAISRFYHCTRHAVHSTTCDKEMLGAAHVSSRAAQQ